jgi:hypothetical protein
MGKTTPQDKINYWFNSIAWIALLEAMAIFGLAAGGPIVLKDIYNTNLYWMLFSTVPSLVDVLIVFICYNGKLKDRLQRGDYGSKQYRAVYNLHLAASIIGALCNLAAAIWRGVLLATCYNANSGSQCTESIQYRVALLGLILTGFLAIAGAINGAMSIAFLGRVEAANAKLKEGRKTTEKDPLVNASGHYPPTAYTSNYGPF